MLLLYYSRMGDIVRAFYIFKLKKNYYDIYQNNPKELYSIFKYLYNLKKSERVDINLLKDLICIIDKNKIDRDIYIKYHKDLIYSKQNNSHIINDLFKDEVSILTIKNIYMYLEVNKNYSSFFDIINKIDKCYFFCDFDSNDYFWINDLKILV